MKSDWMPPRASVELEQFIHHIQSKFDAWKPPRWISDNLSQEERLLIHKIRKDKETVYMWEDKGASFLKMHISQYIEAGEKELSNEKFYEEVLEDPIDDIVAENNKIISQMLQKGEISEKVADFLFSGRSSLPSFYHLLKTHKMPLDEENISDWLDRSGYPIRGIISGRGGPTEHLAGFIDHFLQPGMKELETFLKDTKHTLQLIEGINTEIENGERSLEGVALVTMDIENMYNNIPEALGMGAVKRFLDSRSRPDVSTESLMKGLQLVLKSNYFSFNNKKYKQKGGVGTGIKPAPPYSCIAVGDFESKISEELPPDILEAISFWKRFIDDVFILFKGSMEDCKQLVERLNSILPGIIKLKFEYSTELVEFLDLKIMIREGKLVTDLYVKPSNSQLYLDYRSNHPTHCKNAIVFSQALRIVERCSSQELAEPHFESLKSRFLDRNYPESIVDSQIEKAKKKSRKQLIFQSRKEKNKADKKIRLIFTNNEGNPPLQKWLREGKKFLRSSKAKKIASNLQIVYRQPRNLQRLVAGPNNKVTSEPEESAGSHKCNKPCVSCSVVREASTFRSTNTKKVYKIRQNSNCGSEFVIYLATCLRCQGQYVGKSTTAFRKRHSNHKQEIKHKKGGLGKHFGGDRSCSYKDISFILIEKVEVGNHALLSRREQWWQHQLRAFEENGGNAMCIRKEYGK